MKLAILIMWFVLQCIAWPAYLQMRTRGAHACICYLATWVAFGLGWFAK